jgi:hypothetical protein
MNAILATAEFHKKKLEEAEAQVRSFKPELIMERVFTTTIDEPMTGHHDLFLNHTLEGVREAIEEHITQMACLDDEDKKPIEGIQENLDKMKMQTKWPSVNFTITYAGDEYEVSCSVSYVGK